jgi:WD40 repeat protein
VTSILVFLAFIGSGLPGHGTVSATMEDGTAVVSTTTDPGDAPLPFSSPILSSALVPSLSHRAEQLWVDRAHLNAIANETSISGIGQNVFAGWYLNNKRVSKYNISGSGTPQWTYLCPEAGNTFDVAATFDGILSACNNLMQTHVWENVGSQPTANFETAIAQDIEEVAGVVVLVYVDASYNLVCVDASTGWSERWNVPLQTVGNGIYGVDISSSGNRVLVSAYEASTGAQVYSMTNGALVGSAIGNYGQTKAAISGDGNRVVIGNFNGQIRMFQWSGSAWSLAGSIATGDSWVTAVAISDDGLTVAGGTLGFSPYRGKVVGVNWPSSSAPTQMWEYKNYGDEVSSIAICDDGSVIVAGSWGTYGATSGDVFTALDHTGAVIFNLLDDIDEPGSIFSVDVSDDGSFATASGKAVHARQMGNGGEVYGIQIMDAQAHDVGVIAIVSPAENQQVGNTITPQVTIGNFGTSTESFSVSAWLYEAEGGTQVWSGTANVTSLAPGGQTNVTFSSWTVPSYGDWVFATRTNLASDTYAPNDSLSSLVRAYHDAQAVAIRCPYAENTIGMVMTPLIEVANGGTYSEALQVNLVVNGASGEVYNQTISTSVLAPGAHATVSMPTWTPAEVGPYTAVATASVTDDYVAENDEQSLPFDIVWEIIYDDGGWETMYWVGSLQDDMFATRFTPTVGYPCTITQARIFVNNTDPFSWIAICPDNGSGAPDTANPLYYVENVTAPSALSWIALTVSIPLSSPGDVWLVAHWPDAKSVAVGADITAPFAGRSWWHNTQYGWMNMTAADWMFRLTAMPPTGAPGSPDQPAAFALGLPCPNPSAGMLSIQLQVPSADIQYKVAVYDLSGRCVSTLGSGTSPAGTHTLTWDCMTGSGPAPAGVYFVRLEAGSTVESRKVVILR